VLAFAETIPIIVWRADASGDIDYFNGRWYEYTGLPPDQSLGSESYASIHPDDVSGMISAWQQAVMAREQFEGECRLRGADGDYRWFLVRGRPRIDTSGDVAAWYGTCTDIDAQKIATESLRGAKMRAELLTEADTIFERAFGSRFPMEDFARLLTVEFASVCYVDAVGDDGRLIRRAAVHRDANWQERFEEAPPDQPPWRQTQSITTVLESGVEQASLRVDEAWHASAANDDDHRAWLRALDPQSCINVPLIAGGRRLGVLTVVRTGTLPPFTIDDLATAVELGRRAAANMEHARLYALARENERRAERTAEAERRATQKLSYFADLGERLTALNTLDATLQAVVESLVPDFADWAAVELREGDRSHVAAVHHRHAAPRRAMRMLLSAGATTRTIIPTGKEALRTGKAAIAYGHDRAIGSAHFRSAISVPLVVDSTVRGVLTLAMTSDVGAFSDADRPFVQEIARRIAPAIAQAEIYERERHIAETFQAAVLPRRMPSVGGMHFDPLYEAGKSEALVGGDWFDAFRIPDGRVVITIGDVQGNGLAAATAMAEARQSIRGAAAINPDPAVLLDAADRILTGDADDRFATAWVGIVDPIDFSLRYASAGHTPPYLREADGTIRELEGGGLPLGLAGTLAQRRETLTALVDPGSLLVLFTDGLVESNRDALHDEALLAAALGAAEPATVTAKELRDAVLGSGAAHDDIALLLVRFINRLTDVGDPRARRWTFDVAEPEDAMRARRAVSESLRAGMRDEQLIVAELILAELLGNVVRYAGGRVEVILDQTDGAPVLHVIDDGDGFDHNSRLPADTYAENGRGLFIVKELAREFTVSRGPRGGSHARVVLETRGDGMRVPAR
jgi:PAS domain S-box-containing protein